jgi:hypothetical protein
MPVTEREELTTVSAFVQKPDQWLSKAAAKPVSITRPKKPDITMVNREAWQNATSAKGWLSEFSAIVKYVVERVMGVPNPSCPSDFSWLSLFDLDDLRQFVDETSGTIHSVMQGMRSWDDLDNLIDEWRRSAIALNDDDLKKRFEETIKDIRG